MADASGALVSQQRYLPFGQARTDVGTVTQTDFGYTGQRNLAGLGLMDYHARMYDSLLGRFIQPDDIVSGIANPQSWNRFAYVLNNPIIFTDPTGHRTCLEDGYDCNLSNPNQEIVQAIKDSSVSDADALVTMFSTDRLPGKTPSQRLQVILNATKSDPYIHFAVYFQDSGFATKYQDPYPSSKNQVGHFLTAVYIFTDHNGYLGKSIVVGHEMFPDNVLGPADSFYQIWFGMSHKKDSDLFDKGTDAAFNKIISDGWGPFGNREGNSIQDLRLTYLGRQLAEKIRNGDFKDNDSVADWLNLNIKDSRTVFGNELLIK